MDTAAPSARALHETHVHEHSLSKPARTACVIQPCQPSVLTRAQSTAWIVSWTSLSPAKNCWECGCRHGSRSRSQMNSFILPSMWHAHSPPLHAGHVRSSRSCTPRRRSSWQLLYSSTARRKALVLMPRSGCNTKQTQHGKTLRSFTVLVVLHITAEGHWPKALKASSI